MHCHLFLEKCMRLVTSHCMCGSDHTGPSRLTHRGYWGRFLCTVFALVIAPFFLFLYPVYLNFYVTNLSGQQRDPQLYVESEPHRGLKFYHQKYNPLTPWWNERRLNPRLSGGERAPNRFSHQAVRFKVAKCGYLLCDQKKKSGKLKRSMAQKR